MDDNQNALIELLAILSEPQQSWPYNEYPQRGAFNPRTTVMGRAPPQHYGNALAGTQSGESVRRRDNMFSQPAYQPPQQQGMRGAQSGPADESFWTGGERFAQTLGGYGVGSVGGALGFGMSGGNPIGGAAGATPGLLAVINAQAENPQDVWAHQLMQSMRRRWRGLE